MVVNEKQKWPTNKARYDKNYLGLYGKECPMCEGVGRYKRTDGWIMRCPKCEGLGKVEK